MKIRYNYFILITLSLFIFGCKTNSKGTIGYLNPATFRERFILESAYTMEKLDELGYETIIMHAEDDDAVQLQQGYELIEKGVDALIIVCVNGGTIAPLVREAKKKGIKVIAYNRLINNSEYDLFITGNNKNNAELFCDAALSRKPTGNYVVLGGDRFDMNGFELKMHIDSILKPHIASGDINLLYEGFVEDWSRERAAFELQKVVDIHGPDIDAVIACNDPMGLAVLDVMRKYDKIGEVITMGQDATNEMMKAIINDEAQMTIYHPHQILGYRTAELVDEMLNGKNVNNIANSYTFNGFIDIPTVQINSIALEKEDILKMIENGEISIN